ncbi:MAG: DUF4942 domain-containing protein [Thioploca sp.]|nr:DUF4942 domain-containing protein [Thioploca sp.]
MNDSFILNGSGYIYLRSRGDGYTSWDDVDLMLANLRRDCWRHIVERLELRRFLSSDRLAELKNDLKNSNWPEITQESVMVFAQAHMSQLDVYMEEAIKEVFDFLRPRKSKLKTNSQFEVPHKVIMERWLDSGPYATYWRPNYCYETNMTQLDRVFQALDGAGFVSNSYYGQLYDAIVALPPNQTVGETDYFRFKCFKNGNLHIEFKRIDLLEKFNTIAGGKHLRQAAE